MAKVRQHKPGSPTFARKTSADSTIGIVCGATHGAELTGVRVELPLGIYPSQAAQGLMGVVVFVVHYRLPITTMAVGYGSMLLAIRKKVETVIVFNNKVPESIISTHPAC